MGNQDVKTGSWMFLVMFVLILVNLGDLLAVLVADVSGFGGLGIFIIHMLLTPVMLLVPAALAVPAPKHLKAGLLWFLAGNYAILGMSWLVVAVRAGFIRI